MTPAEIRTAAKALAERIGPKTDVDLFIMSNRMFDDEGPIRATITLREGGSLRTEAASFEEALERLDALWEAQRVEIHRKALATAKARVAELEGAL